VQVADLSASLCAVASVLGAVLARERDEAREKGSGRGSRLDVSMYDAAAAMMIFHLPGLLAGGRMERGQVQLTGAHPNYRVYRTKDGRWLSIGSLEPKFWKRFLVAAGRPDLEGAAFAAMADEDARAGLVKTMTGLVAEKTLAEWQAILDPADACAEPVLEGEEVIRHPHAIARRIAFEADDPKLGKVRVPASPLRPWSEEARYRPAPAPGEHSDEVLAAAGFSPPEIAALRAAKVLG
jgi:crotonobetainyl-CoA:carnitine CoA-transferase CaiB-like acyl-CoA transferase